MDDGIEELVGGDVDEGEGLASEDVDEVEGLGWLDELEGPEVGTDEDVYAFNPSICLP